MIITDRVYGKMEIKENVLIDLINTRAVQRLKDISQQGVPLKYSSQPYFSRYEHSIGVMILLHRINASLKEQIAGLLHDISHPTFSHLIEWVIGDPEKQKHQDDNYENILKNSDVPDVLKKYGYDFREFIDLERYSLLERDAPSLCADRIDYCLRDMVVYGGWVVSDNIINHIKSHNGQIIFDTPDTGYQFAHEYIALQRYSWGNDEHKLRFTIFAEALKKALEIGLIKEEEFYGVEKEIVSKLENSNSKFIIDKLDLLIKGFIIKYNVHNGVRVRGKFRFVNPEVLVDGEIKRLSEIDSFYSSYLNLQKKLFDEIKYVETIPK